MHGESGIKGESARPSIGCGPCWSLIESMLFLYVLLSSSALFVNSSCVLYDAQVKDCLAYLRLAANPCDALAMRRAINTPPRGIGDKTVQALRVLLASARNVPRLESITGPECLMALLEGADLDELQASLDGSVAANAAPIRFSNEFEGALGGGTGTWEGEEDARAGGAPVTDLGGDVEAGWRGFSIGRARLLGEAFRAGEVEGPTRAQANKLRAFAHIMCRLRVVAATEDLPELLRTVLRETDMER